MKHRSYSWCLEVGPGCNVGPTHNVDPGCNVGHKCNEDSRKNISPGPGSTKKSPKSWSICSQEFVGTLSLFCELCTKSLFHSWHMAE